MKILKPIAKQEPCEPWRDEEGMRHVCRWHNGRNACVCPCGAQRDESTTS